MLGLLEFLFLDSLFCWVLIRFLEWKLGYIATGWEEQFHAKQEPAGSGDR